MRQSGAAMLLSSLLLTASVMALPLSSHAQTRSKRHTRHAVVRKAGGVRGAVLSTVDQFEQAYKRKDKKTMLMKLMVPTQDKLALEKRYQWLRGYGPTDLPGTVHPPILFQTSKGSFVPASYSVVSANPADSGRWAVVVKENGTYKDEDGRYKVTRERHFTLSQLKGKWYVFDYVLKENPEDYGFYVDDISDKMTPIGK